MITYSLKGSIKAEQPLATCSKDLLDSKAGGKNKPIPVPTTFTATGEHLMFPATGLRGTLRRFARDVVRQEVINATGNPKPFSLDEHYLLTLGGIKGEGSQDRVSVAIEAEWRRKNPLLSMFGAGDAGVLGFVQGHIGVGNAICTENKDKMPAVSFSGARTDDLYRDKSQIAYLSESDVESLVRQAKGGKDRSSIKTDIKKLDAELKAARAEARKSGNDDKVREIEGRIDALKDQVQAVKDETGTQDVSIGMPLAGWQAIPQGAELEQRMTLVRSNPIELGLLLKALSQFALHPFIGAHFAAGCGMVSGEWEVFEVSLDRKTSLGKVKMTPFDGVDLDGHALKDAVSAFDSFIASKEWNFGIPAVK